MKLSHPSLLNKTHFSFLNSTLSVDDLVEFSFRNNHKHVVISEFNNCHSWVNFYKKAKSKNLIPVFGLQINWNKENLLLLSKNYCGYKNLIRIASDSLVEQDLLENLVVIHLDGEINFLNHPDFYIANTDAENGVYIRENKFLEKEDYEIYALLRAIENGTLVSEELELNSLFKNDYLKNPDFPSLDSRQIKNIYKILDSCEEYSIFDTENKLDFFSSAGIDPGAKIRDLAMDAFGSKKYSSDQEKEEYFVRLNKELDVVTQKGFSEYFCIVHDAINWAKKNDICVGPGRGSVCGSLLAYFLGITEVDPIKYDLLFERFLNIDRETKPDIDIDIANNKRDLLFKYLREKYGPERVAFIVTFQTFKIKNALREAGKAYAVSENELNFCLSTISSAFHSSLDDLLQSNKSLGILNSKYPYLIKGVRRILNFPKLTSIHAAGVIISSTKLKDIVPLSKDKFLDVIQWESDELKDFNLVKFDFLALHYLTILDEVKKSVELDLGKTLDWDLIGCKDQKVFDLLSQGKNAFIFQFDNVKSKGLLQKFIPNSILELALVSAINRPGASEQTDILMSKKFSVNNLYLLPKKFDEFLSETYGLLVYQEQLMQLVSEIMSVSFGCADTFRRKLSSFSEEAVNECRREFIEKGLENKYDLESLNKIWVYISKFAKYSFNKSHALAYAIISYRLAWLKTYHPSFFYRSLLMLSDSSEHLSEIQEAGFNLQYPHVYYSKLEFFNCHENSFYFPLCKVSQLSLDFASKFRDLRIREFKDVPDALEFFVRAKILEEDLRILIRIGFFSCLLKKKETNYYWDVNLSEIYTTMSFVYEDNEKLFDLNLKKVFPSEQKLKEFEGYKKSYLGIDLNKKRIKEDIFKKYSFLSVNKLPLQESLREKYLSFISEIKFSKTSRNTSFVWVKLSDGFYSSPIIAYFGKNIEELQEAVDKGYAVFSIVEKKDKFFKILDLRVLRRDE